MNDNKASAAYHPGDVPVTRPDLDVLIRDLRKLAGDYGLHVRGIPTSHEKDWTSTNKLAWDAADALADERARADQAEGDSTRNRLFGIGVQNQLHAAEVRIADAPHEPTCFVYSHRGVARYCNCWKSAAPTAEQGADQ